MRDEKSNDLYQLKNKIPGTLKVTYYQTCEKT